MTRGANRADLVLYLETFVHTVGVMQTRESLIRVARECAEDLAADGVVYAEVRFAPELHIEKGLSASTMSSRRSSKGSGRGVPDSPITVRVLCTAMRTAALSLQIAELAVRWRDEGVCGFDIAGAEAGYPPTRHLDAFQYVMRENFHITIHAGEAFGLPVDLGSAAVLRRRTTRPRRAHRRRHRRRHRDRRRRPEARSPGQLRP